jgi:hypothetical protein
MIAPSGAQNCYAMFIFLKLYDLNTDVKRVILCFLHWSWPECCMLNPALNSSALVTSYTLLGDYYIALFVLLHHFRKVRAGKMTWKQEFDSYQGPGFISSPSASLRRRIVSYFPGDKATISWCQDLECMEIYSTSIYAFAEYRRDWLRPMLEVSFKALNYGVVHCLKQVIWMSFKFSQQSLWRALSSEI